MLERAIISKNEALKARLFQIEEAAKISIKIGKTVELEFCSLHWDSQFQKYNIEVDRIFPYLTPYKANEMSKELQKAAILCGQINDLLQSIK